MPKLLEEIHAAWIWLAGSIAMAVLATNISWILRDPQPGPLGDAIARLLAWPGRSGLYQALRIIYYIGVPFAALLIGHDAVTERYLGLQPFELPATGMPTASAIITENWVNWARDAGWAAASGALAFVVMAVAWWTYRRVLAGEDLREGTPIRHHTGWALLRDAAFHEAHWAFYRCAPLIALRGHAEGDYWGIWAGLGIVGFEAVLNPAWRHNLGVPEEAPSSLFRVAMAVLSAALFWMTQNLWLAVGVHFVVSWAMSAIVSVTTTRSDHQ